MLLFSPFSFSLLPVLDFPGLIVVTLAMCWMPNQIRRIMAAAKPKHDWTKSYFKAYMILLPFSDTFFYLSSVVNPLLYNVSSQQFRKVFWQVLCCRLTLQHANQEKRQRARFSSAKDSTHSALSPNPRYLSSSFLLDILLLSLLLAQHRHPPIPVAPTLSGLTTVLL